MRCYILFLLCFFTLASCTLQVEESSGCTSDSDCTDGFTCGTGGQCICVDDSSCDEGEFCNEFGSCQRSEGCVSNEDCDEGTFCDVAKLDSTSSEDEESSEVGECIATGDCRVKTHCELGNICSANTCVEGCEDYGDCPLGQPCISGVCAPLGTCDSASFCPLGSSCENGQCVEVAGEHCDVCEPTVFYDTCGDAKNLCLGDQNVPPTTCNSDFTCDLVYPGSTCFQGICRKNFCGVNCQDTSDCPRGYGCGEVAVLTGSLCSSSAQCSSNQCGTFQAFSSLFRLSNILKNIYNFSQTSLL